MFHQKMTRDVMEQIGREVARRLNQKLPRDVARKSSSLIEWFTANWTAIRSVIFEANLPQHMVFRSTNRAQS
jgi:hypothetical protein